jgi:hypothetical protein
MKIFLSYRDDDTAAHARWLSAHLAAHCGAGNIFRDSASLLPGDDFVEALDAELRQSNIVLVLIGQRWAHVTDGTGRRRLDNPQDWIRIAIERALQLRIPILPVLIDGATMPTVDELPPSLRRIAYHQTASLRSAPDYHDIDRLLRALEAFADELPSPKHSIETKVPDLDLGESGPITVFVSHATQDWKWVDREIVRLLKAHGIAPWYSTESIRTASHWEREILRGLESCDWFLLVISPRAATSEWVKDELNWAIHNRPTRIVPVMMEQCDLWAFHIRLPRIEHVDFSNDIEAAKGRLVARFERSERSA